MSKRSHKIICRNQVLLTFSLVNERNQIREARKHTDPDPQHCCLHTVLRPLQMVLYLGLCCWPSWGWNPWISQPGSPSEKGSKICLLSVVRIKFSDHSNIFLIFWRARVCWLLLCLCRPFCMFERCLDSNPESCRSKHACYQLSQPFPYLATRPISLLSHPSPCLATHLSSNILPEYFLVSSFFFTR